MVKIGGTKNESLNILNKCISIKLKYTKLFIIKYGSLLAGEMNELGLRLPVFNHSLSESS